MLLKAEIPSGNIVSISYAQQGASKIRGYGEIRAKRLLVFSQNSIFVNSFHGENYCFSNGYKAGSDSETIIYGSFICNYKPKHFLTLISSFGNYFIRTYSIEQEQEIKGSHDKNTKIMMKRLKKFDPDLFNKVYSQSKFKDIENYRSCNLSTDSNSEGAYAIDQHETKELREFHGQELNCIKTIKNTASGQSEFIIASNSLLGTVIINKKSILLIVVQEIDKRILEIEYWNGYYFILYDNNRMGIYKRDVTGRLEKLYIKNFKLENIRKDLKVIKFKLPKLEWSGRLPDILHKDISTTIILVGTSSNNDNYILKYNICSNQCIGYVCLNVSAEVTSINYGPYDNGPIFVGLSNGNIRMFDYYSLELLHIIDDIINGKIIWMVYEPGNAIIIASEKTIYKLKQF